MFRRRYGIPTTSWAVIVLAAGFALWCILPESLRNQIQPTAHAANFTVNTADDHDDGVCNGADCTLREAINAVNAGAGGDTISFSISGSGVRTINLTSALPIITRTVTIDGTTQTGFSGTPLIELNGSGAGGGANGLVLNASNTSVRSLIINRFSGYGIDLENFALPIITGNYIGTDASGTSAAPNGAGGIKVNCPDVAIGTAGSPRNVISGNNGNGIDVVAQGSPQIQNNFIGTNASGTAALGNSGSGIKVTAPIAGIGGATAGSGNVISGNVAEGILVTGISAGALIRGNFIGTDVSGTTKIPNTGGITVTGVINNISIGGTAPGSGNVISGSTGANAYGIQLNSSSNVPVQGNVIGLNAAGTAKIPNDAGGIIVLGGTGNTIGGTTAGARNVISGNGGAGLLLLTDTAQVQGNYFGTNSAGTAALGNGASGILINGGDNNTIGGTTAGARNVISGNGNSGVRIAFSADGNTVQGNFIGTDASGTNNLSNGAGFAGVLIEGNCINDTIGGTAAGAGNLIAFSQGPGVSVTSASTQDAILGNSIFSNSGLGIDLDADGITANDNCDSDTGANSKQNFPVITSVTPGPTNTTISGTLNSTANTQFRIEFFANVSCDPAGSGEGKVFLGSTNATTDGACNTSFMFVVPNASLTGPIIAATATDPNNNTSEFSACAEAPLVNTMQFNSSSYSLGEATPDAIITVNRSGDTSAPATVGYATSDTAGANNCNVFNGVASSRCDYSTTIGTLHFAANETSKTISIPIIDDSYAEGPESFAITLSNPTGGAFLGDPAMATITITDNDSVTGPNPIDQAGFFVREHYVDFLNREPDTSGFNFWTNEITSCGANQACIDGKRINVSAAFYLSIEFQQTGYLVERIYKAAYGDANGTSTFGGAHQLPVPIIRLNEFLPDTQEIGQGVVVGQGNWQQQLEDNKNAFTADFVQRSRFTTAFPTSLTPTQFVDKLFQNAGVSPSAQDRNAAINEFGGAGDTSNLTARAKAVRDVAENATLATNEFNRAFVLMQYFGYLRRNPNDPQDNDYTGFDFWLTKLNSFTLPGDDVLVRVQNADMVKAFILSGEYRNRFGP